ncbi:3-oxoacyl-[acyl-carrier-protein] synthase III C-terminal domain-containing protein, partial [Streptomyces sp. NPDC058953]|uniref:3-oxoacyl-[acyl-carrier-protein] synthase III C-terminal domain-containing protein n=1 Tax=Streptomyces sp. NPDC058953 TaxID=3346676 RepID=UPI0036C1B738
MYRAAGPALVRPRRPGFARLRRLATVSEPELEAMHRGHDPFGTAPFAVRRPMDLQATKRAFVDDVGISYSVARVGAGEAEALKRALSDADVELSDVDWFVLPHFGLRRLSRTYLRTWGIAPEVTTWPFGRTVGHLGAGDQFAGLAHLVDSGLARPGRLVLLTGVGAGFTWSSAVVEIEHAAPPTTDAPVTIAAPPTTEAPLTTDAPPTTDAPLTIAAPPPGPRVTPLVPYPRSDDIRPSRSDTAGGRPVVREQHRADVVIVGSGYGGAIAALRLAEAGVDAVLLERGRRWPVDGSGTTFATQAAPDGRAAWLSRTSPLTDAELDVYCGVLEFVPGDGMNLLAGAGVGGASLASNGTMCLPSEELFAHTLGDVLDYREMVERWYPEARELIGCAPIPDDVYESPFYRSARSFADQLDRAGIPWSKVDLAVDWDAVREEMTGARVRSHVDGLNVFGVNSGAQLSLDRTLLARAEASGRLDVRPLSTVTAVGPAARARSHKEKLAELKKNKPP